MPAPKKPPKVKVSYMICAKCETPHSQAETCAEAEPVVEEVTVATIRNRARKRKGAVARFSLTKKQRAEIFRGQSPRITVPCGKSPFKPGDYYDLPGSRNIWLKIEGVESGKDRDTIVYTRCDERARLLRASPHGVDFEAIRRGFDSTGHMRPVRDGDELTKAAEESAYTSSPGAALRLEKEAISREVQEQMSRETKEDRAMRRDQEIAKVKAALECLDGNPDFNEDQGNVRHMQRKLARMQEESRADRGMELAA